jgi:hypothetical protein
MKKYFSISENNTHIATLIAQTGEELASKIKIACDEHFDSDCTLNFTNPEQKGYNNWLNINDYINGKSGFVKLVDDDNKLISVFISETWLY